MPIFDDGLSFINAPRPDLFERLALRVFRCQFEYIPLYREYCLSLHFRNESRNKDKQATWLHRPQRSSSFRRANVLAERDAAFDHRRYLELPPGLNKANQG